MFRGTRQATERQVDHRVLFLKAFESDAPVEFVAVRDSYTNREEYYEAMMQNVLAEAVASYRGGGAQRLRLPVRRSHGDFVVSPSAQGGHGSAGGGAVVVPAARGAAVASIAAELQLKDNVVSLNGRAGTLFWVSKCDAAEINGKMQATIEGWSLTNGRLEATPDIFGEELTLHVHLFCGDYANRYRCSAELCDGASRHVDLERAVLDPRSPSPGTYVSTGFPHRFRTDLMSINDEQRRAVSGLRNRVEVIHGPPGTGKSTTIFHVLSARLPRGALAVVTCVTNQAIDAVAEKLAQTHDSDGGLRLLVLGNPGRVGSNAAKYTMEKLCIRDSLVIFMQRVTARLQRVDEGLDKLQQRRVSKFCREHFTSRLSAFQIQQLPASQARLREHEEEMRLRFGRSHVALALNLVKMHIEAVNEIKKKIAFAIVKKVAMWVPTKSGQVGFTLRPTLRKTWNVEHFHSQVREALACARASLEVARSTAPARTVRNTRILLCTIPSSYKVMQLKEEYVNDFPGQLFMSVLDEAAATAETYVPLLIRLGVENLLMLGDHKQLSPLVMASGGDRMLQEKRLDRSLMERAIDCGVVAHPLRLQYRMPVVLCDLVSRLFYDGELITGNSNSPAAMLGGLSLSGALRWHNVVVSEVSVGTSKVNCGEAAYVVKLLSEDPLLSRTRDKILVVTLYKPQVTLLQHLLVRSHSSNVEVVTVDAVQGSEAPHIVLSTVRSNSGGSIGFASNPRRLNVAISRAQKTLTIVGNATTLASADSNWAEVVNHFERKGEKINVSESALRKSSSWEDAQSKMEEMVARAGKGGGGKCGGDKGGHGKGGGTNGFKAKGSSKGFGKRDCTYFLQGRCTRGSSCTFRH